jgi:hypothetical protein
MRASGASRRRKNEARNFFAKLAGNALKRLKTRSKFKVNFGAERMPNAR